MKLHRFPVVDTNGPDEMRDALVNHYGATEVDIRRDVEPFRGIGNVVLLRHLDLCYCSYSTDVGVRFPATAFVKQQFALTGSGQATVGRASFHVSPDETGVVPSGVAASHIFGAHLSQLVLRIEAAALRTKLVALIGRPVGQNIEFAASPVMLDSKQRRLRRLVEFFAGELDRDDETFSSSEFAEYEQALMVSFLTANRHNFSHLLEAETASAAPWQVRVAEEYIAANWNRPLTIEALADATGVGVRTLFQTFKDARGYSPMVFLKRVRLENARRLLQAPDETTSVTAVGLMCGFNSFGHFARNYRDAYGELPSQTLAATRWGGDVRRGRRMERGDKIGRTPAADD